MSERPGPSPEPTADQGERTDLDVNERPGPTPEPTADQGERTDIDVNERPGPTPEPTADQRERTGIDVSELALEPRRRRVDRKLLLASAAIALGFVLIGVGLLRAVTGDEVTDLPNAIESISPPPDAEQVLQQTQVVVDLLEGYEGELTIDDVELTTFRLDEVPLNIEPGQQIEVPPGAVFEPGNGTLSFTPGEGTGIDSFDPGRHTVAVRFWRTEEGPDTARSYDWTFEAV